jgi:endonuclease/exonuclease/phosphatase family metal-dependent hydrolase
MTLNLLLISLFTFVELNCENLFDCVHDSLKNDYEFVEGGSRHWNFHHYWQKLNSISRDIVSCGRDNQGNFMMPDMVALCEVENDSVMRDLTKRSLLRNARYEYVITNSPDERGIDVALMYSPFSFAPISTNSFRVEHPKDTRPTRDILYVSGQIITGDTLHVYVVHAPSRAGGEQSTRSYRMLVAKRLCYAIDSLRQKSPLAKIIVAGDFNDYADDASLKYIYEHDMENISSSAMGSNGAKGTYRYKGEWGSLDQILMSPSFKSAFLDCRINDTKFLIEEDETYGGVKPKRFFNGFKYNNGFSDHLPLVARFRLNDGL